jgi:hypothetical protein
VGGVSFTVIGELGMTDKQLDEAGVKREMRLWALEVLVTNVFAMLCALDPDPEELAAKIRQQMLEGARQRGFPGYDPAQSDLLSAEFEAALSRLLAMAYEQIRHGRGSHAR